ncbi:Decreased Expression In Renal And Prostate Cancer Protein [Manis pentadactyla]|nr:Decreased Expression In Renal And Prostate Cancer Protein [Manis pentadactyla]
MGTHMGDRGQPPPAPVGVGTGCKQHRDEDYDGGQQVRRGGVYPGGEVSAARGGPSRPLFSGPLGLEPPKIRRGRQCLGRFARGASAGADSASGQPDYLLKFEEGLAGED